MSDLEKYRVTLSVMKDLVHSPGSPKFSVNSLISYIQNHIYLLENYESRTEVDQELYPF